jgi:hypothetical protein
MNKNNLKILINTISRLPEDRHYFPHYQSRGDNLIATQFYTTLDSWAASDNKASVFGYFVLTPEWIEVGGSINSVGEPVFANCVGVPAIRAYLDTTFNTARKFVCGDILYKDIINEDKIRIGQVLYSEFYEKDIKLITLPDVVNRLSKFLPCAS